MFHCTPLVTATMTDKDVIDRIHRILGPHSKVNGPYWGKLSKKPAWRVSICGQTGAGWMMTLWSLMGERRRGQIESVLQKWKGNANDPRRHKGVPAKCHPDQPNKSRGLCLACYRKHQREKRAGLQVA